jgi:uncharacterized protein YeaO (DUF488 family)
VIAIKRAYERAARSDGTRILVERLWPRGVKKTELRLDGWAKEIAPSAALRTWYGHDVAKWPEFQQRYRAELRANAEALQPLLTAARQGPLTLVYAARDEAHNSALVLRKFLESRL